MDQRQTLRLELAYGSLKLKELRLQPLVEGRSISLSVTNEALTPTLRSLPTNLAIDLSAEITIGAGNYLVAELMP